MISRLPQIKRKANASCSGSWRALGRTKIMKPMALMVTLMVACSALAATAWGQRQALSTDGFTSSRMQEAHADGYICWFLGLSFSGVVCIKDLVNTTLVPTTAQDLRRILYSVNLRTWLPNLLCSMPPPPQLPPSGGNGARAEIYPSGEKVRHAESSPVPPPLSSPMTASDGGMAGGERCREVVEAALSVPESTVWGHLRHRSGSVDTSVAIDDVPWVKVMEACMQPAFRDNFMPFDCPNLYSVLASQRGKAQLLPALQDLWRQQQQQQQRRQMRNESPPVLVSGEHRQQSSPLPPAALSPAAGTIIESLLSLLDCDVERSGGINNPRDEDIVRAPSIKPFLRVLNPEPATRVSGNAVAFIAEVNLGEALEEQLREAKQGGGSVNDNGGGNHGRNNGPTTDHQYGGLPPGGVFTEGGEKATEEQRGEDTRVFMPSFHRCEVRVVADGEMVARIPLHDDDNPSVTTTAITASSAAAADESEDTDSLDEGQGAGSDRTTENKGAKTSTTHEIAYRHRIAKVVTPDYTKSRCSEHPFKAARLAAGGTVGGVGRLWGGWDGDEDTWRLEAREVDRVCTLDASGPHRMHGEVACCYGKNNKAHNNSSNSDTEQEEETCEIWASSEGVEYLHTGASESDGGRKDFPASGSASGSASVFDPPPDHLSVSLHLESSPDVTETVVSVPRWSSDGEVWEVAFKTCSEVFGPSQGILVNLNDCVDLITTSISAKRADLYHSTVLRLDAYLKGRHPQQDLEGHTGAIPEKVEALGGIARNGGDRVRTVCEVGFNSGHSSLNWLLSSDPSVRVLSFDLGEHDYVEIARDFLEALFPERLQLILGDSRETIPAHTAAEALTGRDPHVCDVIFVDGAHSEDGAYADLVNFRAKTSRGWHVLALDDMELSGVSAAWGRLSKEQDGDEEGNRDGRGKVRIDRVVRGSAERYAHAKENAVGDWNISYENSVHRLFVQRGYFSLGLGAFRF